MNSAYSLEQPRKRTREKGREGEKGWRRRRRKGEGLGGEKEGGGEREGGRGREGGREGGREEGREGGREEEAKNNGWLHKGKVNTIWNTE